jgi:N-methylhydantoinase A/acetophenone carboxylase
VVCTAKVLTTPHDVTEGFLDCVRLGCHKFELDLDEFLRRTSVARLSTTIGTNILVQRKGARIGLLVTAGAEADFYGDGPAKALGEIIAAEMVMGIAEAVDDAGRVVVAPDKDAVLAAVRGLIQRGAQLVVVSLRNSWRNPANELAIRAMVRERYPIHYLRSVPVQLGVEVVHDRDDHARTNSALLNAYIHGEMARVLFRAEDRLRAAGYARPLLIVHASGGNARVAKTVALNTLHSGPAVAVKGAAELCRWLDLDHVVSADMGGTSFDIGVVLGRAVALEPVPTIEHLRIATPTIQVGSVGLGGGSIARLDGETLRVGPESAGSAPGPVCYGKGGGEPTVTDANLILGFIDPDNFLGGRMKLDRDGTRRAIERRLGRKLGLSVEQVAAEIRRTVGARMAEEITAYLAETGVDPGETTLFSVGGAGPLHACDIAEQAGLKQAMAFPFGSVFSSTASLSDRRRATSKDWLRRSAIWSARRDATCKEKGLPPTASNLLSKPNAPAGASASPPPRTPKPISRSACGTGRRAPRSRRLRRRRPGRRPIGANSRSPPRHTRRQRALVATSGGMPARSRRRSMIAIRCDPGPRLPARP